MIRRATEWLGTVQRDWRICSVWQVTEVWYVYSNSPTIQNCVSPLHSTIRDCFIHWGADLSQSFYSAPNISIVLFPAILELLHTFCVNRDAFRTTEMLFLCPPFRANEMLTLCYCHLPYLLYLYSYFFSVLEMEPLIKESTSRLAEKISAIAEKGESVEAIQ